MVKLIIEHNRLFRDDYYINHQQFYGEIVYGNDDFF